MDDNLIVIDNGVLYFDDGPNVSISQIQEIGEALQSAMNRGATPDTLIAMSGLNSDQVSLVDQLVDWLRTNQRKFEEWVKRNPATYEFIKAAVIAAAALAGIDIDISA